MSEVGDPITGKSFVDIFTYDGDVVGPQARRKLGSSGRLSLPAYLHSFGVTPNYVVLPLTLGFGHHGGCIGKMDLLCSFVESWQGIHVVDKDGVTKVFDTTPFMYVHIVNAFENATGATLDVGIYNKQPFSRTGQLDIPMFLNKTLRDSNEHKATVRRLHMHMSGPLAGQTTYTDIPKTPNSTNDFYRVNPKHIGMPYCYYYATEWFHDGRSYANMAILKQNICDGSSTYWSETHLYVGEPHFIPGISDQEDDGLVVFVALDGDARCSRFVTLDAKTMTEVPSTRTELPNHIPFTAHGDFFPDKKAVAVV